MCICLCVCEYIQLCVRASARGSGCVLSPRAPTPPQSAPSARLQKRRLGPGGRGRDARPSERAAPRAPPPRRLCPLNQSPSRLQLISHVTFYLLSPGASCPRTVLLRRPRVAPPQPASGAQTSATLGEAAGSPGALTGPLSARASGASLGQQSGGRAGERALATAGRPSDPRGAVSGRPEGVPCAQRQERGRHTPAGTRAGAPWGGAGQEMAARQE